VSQLPDPQSLNELADAFERLQGRRSDPAEDAHRRGLERVVLGLAATTIAALIGVCSWISVDPQGRSKPEQRQQALQVLGSMGAALVGAVAGYSARGQS
jgi:hypothetical protein